MPCLQLTAYCAITSLVCIPFLFLILAISHSYVGFTAGKGQIAGPIVLENVSFAPSGGVMNMMSLVIFCVFSVLISFLQGDVAPRPR